MAGNISAANIKLGADIAGLLSGLRTASQAVSQHTDGINRGLTRAYREADTASRNLRGGITRLGSEVQDLGKKMALVGTLPAILAGAAAYKQFADIQKLTIGLKQYGETIETVKTLAKLPNISIEGAAKSLIQLRAVGIASTTAQRAIKAFGNAITAAGKSSEDLNPALTNVVQFLSTGVVSAADVKELANRIPQTRKALMSAFGTASGEELTKIGPEKVVMGLISELEKLPPVAGGASMAMEKFSDSAKFAAATVGESIDKAIDLTGKISYLADALEIAANSFSDLSPKSQTFAVTLAALAAAAPLVVTAIGAIISAGSALAVGLGIAGATVGAVAAAVVIAGSLIITYWAEIKNFLTETGWWSTVSDLAESTLMIITNAFKAVGSLLMGDWKGLWNDLRNTVAGAVNFLNTVMFGLVKQIGLVVGAFVGLIGMDGIGKKIREWAHGLDDVVRLLNIAETKAPGQSVVSTNDYAKQFAADDAQTKAWEERQAALAKIKPASNIASLSIKELGEKLTSLKDAYEALKPGEASYTKSKASIAAQVKQVTGLIDSQSKALNTAKKHVKESAEEYDKMSSAQFKIYSINLSMKWQQEQDALKSTIKSYKELFGVVTGLNLELKKPIGSTLGGSVQSGLNKAKAATGAVIDSRIDGQSEFQGKDPLARYEAMYVKKSGESAEDYRRRLSDIKEATDGANEQINQSIRGTAAEVGISFGEMIGNLATGVDSIQSFGKRVVGALGQMLKEIGKSLIAFGTAGKALEFFKDKPGLAIAAGIAVTAAGQALSNSVSKSASKTRFAKGGFAYNEVNAIVGDNPNARFDPEMIAPYSKVDQSIKKSINESGTSGGEWFQKEIKVRGSELMIVLERAQKENKFLQAG